MKLRIIYLAAVLISMSIHAQQTAIPSLRVQNAFENLVHKVRKPQKLEQNIKGSPYFNDKLEKGRLFVEDKEVKQDYTVRYDAFNDEIEVHKGQNFDYLLKSSKVSCLIGKDKYVFRPFIRKESDDMDTGFLKVLFKGTHFSILMRESKTLKAGTTAINPMTSSHPARLIGTKEIYFSNSKKPAFRLKQKKKTILSIIDSKHREAMSKFIKKQKLKLKNENDLVAFFKQYNTLTSNDQTVTP